MRARLPEAGELHEHVGTCLVVVAGRVAREYQVFLRSGVAVSAEGTNMEEVCHWVWQKYQSEWFTSVSTHDHAT